MCSEQNVREGWASQRDDGQILGQDLKVTGMIQSSRWCLFRNRLPLSPFTGTQLAMTAKRAGKPL